jgi:hypothetical protein
LSALATILYLSIRFVPEKLRTSGAAKPISAASMSSPPEDTSGTIPAPTLFARPGGPVSEDLQSIIDAAVTKALQGVLPKLQQALDAAQKVGRGRRANGIRAASRRRTRREELTKWVADRRGRRVPKFVIALTGLDTKTKIVARYGENAAFGKGKPLPPEKAQKSSPTPKPKKSAAKRQARKAAAPKKTAVGDAEKTSDAKRVPPVAAARIVVARSPTVRKNGAAR